MIARVATATSTYRATLTREFLILGGLAAAFLSLLVFINHTRPTELDRRLAGEIQAIPWGELAFLPRLGSDLGGGVYGFFVIPAVTAVALAVSRRWRLVLLLLAVFALHFVAIAPKVFVLAYRPSPVYGVDGAGGLQSFPSGHVQWATSFYGFLAYLAWRAAPGRLKYAVLPVYAVAVLATMLGRIELGRHWPLDTLAGVVAGLIALRLVIALHDWLHRRGATGRSTA